MSKRRAKKNVNARIILTKVRKGAPRDANLAVYNTQENGALT